MANMPFFSVIHCLDVRSGRYRQTPLPNSRSEASSGSAAAAYVFQLRIHPRVFRADRIHIFGRVGLRGGRSPR
jgi:hypothetical protein